MNPRRLAGTSLPVYLRLREHDRQAGTFGHLASGRHLEEVREGELVAVTRQGDVLRLSPHKLDLEEIEQQLADVQRAWTCYHRRQSKRSNPMDADQVRKFCDIAAELAVPLASTLVRRIAPGAACN
jgi:hypothetical protein